MYPSWLTICVTVCLVMASGCDQQQKPKQPIQVPEAVKVMTAERAKELVAPHMSFVKALPVIDLSKFPNLSDLKPPLFRNDLWGTIHTIDTSVRTRPRPDFTDIGVSQLFTNLGGATPEALGCHVASMRGFVEGSESFDFIGSHPFNTAPTCYDAWMFWNHSPNQRMAWNATSSTIREQFLTALASYYPWVQKNAGSRCVIQGLAFASTNTNPYDDVQFGPGIMPDGSTAWYIQLRQRMLYEPNPQ